jgi:hypothetical protein
MSIHIQNDLLNINPAYNESIITYNSNSFTAATKSDVILDGKTFTVYPIGNEFTYNFRDYVKVKINENNFQDLIIPDGDFMVDDETLSLTINPTIKIYRAVGSPTTGDTSNFTYKFTKNVEQLIGYKQKIENDNSTVKVLLPTTNYIDYSITYFEGYPSDFAIYGLTSGDTFYIKNTTTLNQTPTYSATTSEVKRIFLSDGAGDSTLTDEMALSYTTNKCELWVNGEFVANINIRKVDSKCGVMLKWFNHSGSYSYWLFDPIYQTSIQGKKLDEIGGVYDNLYNVTSLNNITGKDGNQTMKISTKFNDFDKQTISSIITSPKVELYIHNEPFNLFVEGSFIGVILNDTSMNLSNKTPNNKLDITITLPDLLTPRL